METSGTILARLVLIYLATGLILAAYFVLRGAARIDSRARGASLFTRLLWAPGAVALWPLLIAPVMRGKVRAQR